MLQLPFSLNKVTITSIVVGGIGVMLLLAGVIYLVQSYQDENSLEIISSEEKIISKEIAVDIEGAVQKPGVYKLPADSRLSDLLILAGGLSSEADRAWVDRTLNKAQKLEDSYKLFIPSKNEGVQAATSNLVSGATTSKMININTASASQLDTLYGIGPATAQKIIENRPYTDINDLLNKKIVKANVFEAIKNQISVF